MNQKHCSQPQNHEPKFTFFCFSCAAKENVNCHYVIFCTKCNKQYHKDHKEHRDYSSIQSKFFKERLEKFKNYLINQYSNLPLQNHPFTHTLITDGKINFAETKFKKWLIQTQFWKLAQHSTNEEANKKISSCLLRIIQQPKTAKNNSSEDLQASVKTELIINWGNFSDQNGVPLLQKMFEQASSEKEKLLKQKYIIDILIEAYSCIQVKSRQQMVHKINKSIQKFPRELSLLMMKLYLMQLHKGNFSEWQPILNQIIQIQPNIKNSPFSIFIQSHKFWVKLDKEIFQRRQKEIIFVDSVSGNLYKLSSPQEYVSLLNNGILTKSSSILYAAKGLGLLAQNKYPQALKAFQSASQNSNQQSFKMNQFYAEVNNKSLEKTVDVQSILNQLHNKSKSYIINAIRYLKKQGLHQKIIFCHHTLQNQKNQSIFSTIEYIKALLKLNCIEQAQQVKDSIPVNKINQSINLRLDRKIKYAQARFYATNQQFEQCTDKCRILVDLKRTSSACYSLASSYYNQNKWEEAQRYIDEALSMKQSDKYKKLKLYILILKKDIGSAKQLLSQIAEGVIDPKICEMLLQSN